MWEARDVRLEDDSTRFPEDQTGDTIGSFSAGDCRVVWLLRMKSELWCGPS